MQQIVMPNVNEDVEMQEEVGQPLKYVFLCQKDSKEVVIYNLVKDEIEKRNIDMDSSFMTNF